MNNNRKWLTIGALVGGVGLIGFALFKYFKTQIELAKNFDWKILGVKLTGFDMYDISGTVTLNFINNSDLEILVEDFYVEFYINGEYAGFVEETNPFLLAPKGTSTIKTNFSVSAGVLIENLNDSLAYLSREKDAFFDMRGTARVKTGFITVSIPVEFNTSLSQML
jgi:hypothetical protein